MFGHTRSILAAILVASATAGTANAQYYNPWNNGYNNGYNNGGYGGNGGYGAGYNYARGYGDVVVLGGGDVPEPIYVYRQVPMVPYSYRHYSNCCRCQQW